MSFTGHAKSAVTQIDLRMLHGEGRPGRAPRQETSGQLAQQTISLPAGTTDYQSSFSGMSRKRSTNNFGDYRGRREQEADCMKEWRSALSVQSAAGWFGAIDRHEGAPTCAG